MWIPPFLSVSRSTASGSCLSYRRSAAPKWTGSVIPRVLSVQSTVPPTHRRPDRAAQTDTAADPAAVRRQAAATATARLWAWADRDGLDQKGGVGGQLGSCRGRYFLGAS